MKMLLFQLWMQSID